MPILPTSCSGAARRISETCASGSPSCLRQQRRHLADPLGVLAGVVVAELRGARQPLDDLDLRRLELARPLAHLRFEHLVLALDLEVEEARLEQRPDPQQDLVGVERLVDEVLGAARQRLAPRFRRHVAGQHQDRQVATPRRSRSARPSPPGRPCAACAGRAGSDRAGTRRRASRASRGSVVLSIRAKPARSRRRRSSSMLAASSSTMRIRAFLNILCCMRDQRSSDGRDGETLQPSVAGHTGAAAAVYGVYTIFPWKHPCFRRVNQQFEVVASRML